MTRIDRDSMDWCALTQLAQQHGVKLIYRAARCQHGRTRRQPCRDCDAGYATDHATYAHLGDVAQKDGRALIAVSDDGDDVAYISTAAWARLDTIIDGPDGLGY